MTRKDYDDFNPNERSVFETEAEEELFVLLSCYLDGEVTPRERQQVDALLDSDARAKQLYQRLAKLRTGIRSAPVPASETTPEETVDLVFVRMRRQRQQRFAWAGTAIAALFVAVVSGLQLNPSPPTLQMASTPSPTSLEIEASPQSLPSPNSSPAPQKESERSLMARALFVE
ncbi:MAG: hypothetical protein J7641_19785 [Cyanobacteria bacterium SID2]|nr:hypothetical protein [Cyanobacteria bacterium SID2]MBP0004224.1 hypothetical protein [Cyanobacteria bacterium SBC]